VRVSSQNDRMAIMSGPEAAAKPLASEVLDGVGEGQIRPQQSKPVLEGCPKCLIGVCIHV
jgi:hypothetical protein